MTAEATTPSADVLIVGAGPVGLTLALLLSRHGIRTLVVEKYPALIATPRAVGLDDESMRIWQSCGIAEDIRDFVMEAQDGETVFTYRSARGAPLFHMHQTSKPYGYSRGVTFLQHEVDEVLYESCRRSEHVTVLIGYEVETVTQTPTQTSLSGRRTDGSPFAFQGRYLVGCDGANSLVRSALGLTLADRGQPSDWVVVDIHSAAAEAARLRAGVEVWCDHRRPAAFIPLPLGYQRWEFMLRPGEAREPFLRDDALFDLISARKALGDGRIVRKVAVSYRARLVTAYRRARIMLAGDAAHTTPPFAGQGLATGLRDAANLAWKLAEVIRGRCPEHVLDTYEQERRPHQQHMLALANSLGNMMMPRTAPQAALRHIAFRVIERVPPLRHIAEIRGQHIAAHLRHGCLTPGGRAGDYLPQPCENGQRFDDRLGNGFAVLAFDRDGMSALPDGLRTAWPAREARAVRIDSIGRDAALFRCFDRWLGGCREHVLIVRPDRIVYADLTRT